MAWTTSDTRYESAGFAATQETSPINYLMNDGSILDEQTGDTTTFMNWYCQKVNKTVLTQADFKGHAYEVVKAFYPNVIHLQFQMEECHKMLTYQINWVNLEGDQLRIDVSLPLHLGGPPIHGTIQTQFFFNKDLDHLRYGNNGSRLAMLISKMKAARYLDFGLELLVQEQMRIDEFYIERHDSPSHRREVKKHMRILSVVRIKAFSRYGYDYLSKIVLRIADFHEHKIAKKDFKNLYPSDFEDLNLLLLQGHLDHLPSSDKRWDAKGFEFKHDYTTIESPRAVVFSVNNNERKITRFNEMYKFSDGTLTRILEALDYKVKEYRVNRLNPEGTSETWNALLVVVYEILTTDYFRELNEHIISAFRTLFLRLNLPDHRFLYRWRWCKPVPANSSS
nr:hypothetical protein [Tanacetum cinerariifolium]